MGEDRGFSCECSILFGVHRTHTSTTMNHTLLALQSFTITTMHCNYRTLGYAACDPVLTMYQGQ